LKPIMKKERRERREPEKTFVEIVEEVRFAK